MCSSDLALGSFFGLTRRRKRERGGDAARRDDEPMRRAPLPLRTGLPELRTGGVEEEGPYLEAGVPEEEEFADDVVAVDIRCGVH